MAQTTLTIYAGDQLYKFVDFPFNSYHLTGSGTAILSGSLGHSLASLLDCWFGILVSKIAVLHLALSADLICAGNANSRGNVYGVGASVAVFLVPLVFIRLFAPQQYAPGVVLMTVRVILGSVNHVEPFLSPRSL